MKGIGVSSNGDFQMKNFSGTHDPFWPSSSSLMSYLQYRLRPPPGPTRLGAFQVASTLVDLAAAAVATVLVAGKLAQILCMASLTAPCYWCCQVEPFFVGLFRSDRFHGAKNLWKFSFEILPKSELISCRLSNFFLLRVRKEMSDFFSLQFFWGKKNRINLRFC